MFYISKKIVSLVLVLTATLVFFKIEPSHAAKEPNFKAFVGEWIRPGRGHIIRVRDVKLDGSVDAGYFNPVEINVAEANVSEWKGFGKLFIKLDDAGYPGSTYTLYYYTEKDALGGYYYQAALKQTFEVVFVRKRPVKESIRMRE